MDTNGTMMQYFEWDLPPGKLWKQLRQQAPELARNGITAVWIPPAYKGAQGEADTGYSPYDLWDLGEFAQKGTVPTKYGTKQELRQAIDALHDEHIQVYADIVLDHKMGADATEEVAAREVDPENRRIVRDEVKDISAWTHFFFPGRQKRYSDFEWHWYHFSGIDYDAETGDQAVYLFDGKDWAEQVDGELGNFDYLMGANIDLSNPEVIAELTQWGQWFVRETDIDGFRFDAVKHMKFGFYKNWIEKLRSKEKAELFSVGEYWNASIGALEHYIAATEGKFSLFDVPLHYRLYNAATSFGYFDMRTIFDDTLTQRHPELSVSFVDNHDTQPGQALQSFVPAWFKPHAYALILLREAGYPCVFYGDYYGIPASRVKSKKTMLDHLLKARRERAYGEQHDYFDDPDIIGWTREGDVDKPNSGLAVLLTNAKGGEKTMSMGERNAGKILRPLLGDSDEEIQLDADGAATFTVPDAGCQVWTVAEPAHV